MAEEPKKRRLATRLIHPDRIASTDFKSLAVADLARIDRACSIRIADARDRQTIRTNIATASTARRRCASWRCGSRRSRAPSIA